MTATLSEFSFVEGTVSGPYGCRHAVVMARLDSAAEDGWAWVNGPVMLPGETFDFRGNDVADWAATAAKVVHG